jgi:hypothetical protein
MHPFFRQLLQQAARRAPFSPARITKEISKGFGSLPSSINNVRKVTGSALQKTFGPDAGRLFPGTFQAGTRTGTNVMPGIGNAGSRMAPLLPSPPISTKAAGSFARPLIQASSVAPVLTRLQQGARYIAGGSPVGFALSETVGHLAFPPGIDYSSAHGTLKDPSIPSMYKPKTKEEPPRGTQSTLNGKPVFWTGSDYGWQSGPTAVKAGLLGSEVVGGYPDSTLDKQASPPLVNDVPGGGNTGSNPPRNSPVEERAYQQEVSRVAQLTAQNPELQRYEAARKIAAAQGASPEQVQAAEDIGMQIWQSKYGNTPMAQPGGAVGSYNPLMQRTFGYQTGMAPGQVAQAQETAAPIPVAPGEMPYQQGDLGTRATLETGYDPAAYGLSPEIIDQMKSRLIKQATK